MVMTEPPIHASCIAIGGRAILIEGASGSGKSDLALRLIDRGAHLVSDDYTLLELKESRVFASPPATIEGRIEIRGVGIAAIPFERGVPVALAVSLDQPRERLPEPRSRDIMGLSLPLIAVAPFEASAPLKVEHALALLGLN